MDIGKGHEQERKLFRQSPPGKPETPPRATRLDGLIPALYIKHISKTQDYVTQKRL